MIDATTIDWQRWDMGDRARTDGGAKRITHRAYVALGGRIKRRAVFEKDLFCTQRLQPCQRLKGLCNRCLWGYGTGFQRDNHSIGLQRFCKFLRWDADGLYGAHSAAYQH